MAAKNKDVHLDNLRELRGEWQPERIVIHVGTGFGTALAYIALGAVLGASATYLALKNSSSTRSLDTSREEALRETERGAARLRSRLTGLSGRVKDLAGRAREAAQIVNEQVRPAWQEAFREAVEDIDKTKSDKDVRDEPEGHPT